MGPYRIVPLVIFAIIIGSASTACNRSSNKDMASMTTEQIIRLNANTTIGNSITAVALSLGKHTIFVATDSTTTTEPKAVTLERLRFKTAKDNQGRTWAYAYTNEAEFSRAFPGGAFVELSFRDFFGIIDGDPQFAGIFLNAGSDASYRIPREVFGNVKQSVQ